MDLLEYQGKQLFAAHGVPVPSGKHATTVDDAVAAANEIGYPCVVKAQVRIGGRGKAGGIKVANDEAEAREHAEAILGMDIRGFTVHDLWVEQASDIAAEHYASIILDRGAKKLLAIVTRMGGMDVEAVAEEDPNALVRRHLEPGEGMTAEIGRELAAGGGNRRGRPGRRRRDAREALRGRHRRGRDPDRDQPADRHRRSQRGRPRLQGHDRRQRPVPPPRAGRARRRVSRGPAGGDGQGEGPHLRQARRRHRHPRQRRRPLHVDARRRRPGGRRAGELPRRRRRLEGRGDRRRARGDHLRREGAGHPVQHLRRHHPLRRGRQGASSRPPSRSTSTFRWSCAWTAPTPRRACACSTRPACPTSTRRRRCWGPPSASWSWPRDGDHRRQRHEARRLGPDRARGQLPRASATATTAPTWSPASRPARAARTSTACRSSTRSRRPSTSAAPTPR